MIFAILKQRLIQLRRETEAIFVIFYIFAVLLRKIVSVVYRVQRWQSKVHSANVAIMPYFQAIDQPVAEILRFNGFFFKWWPSNIFFRYFSEINMTNKRRRAKFHTDRSNRCGDIAIS